MALHDDIATPASPEEILVFETALGRPLGSFPPGLYALHMYDPEGGFIEGMPEPDLAPVDLRAMAAAAGLDADEIESLDEDALRQCVVDELGETRLGEGSDGFPKLAEAPSMLELLRIMVERDYIGVNFIGDPEEGDLAVSDERLDELSGLEKGRYERFVAISDLHLRRVALALHGELAMMGLEYDYAELFYCQGVLLRRPGWEFVCGWDAIPHRQEEGSAILYHPSGAR